MDSSDIGDPHWSLHRIIYILRLWNNALYLKLQNQLIDLFQFYFFLFYSTFHSIPAPFILNHTVLHYFFG